MNRKMLEELSHERPIDNLPVEYIIKTSIETVGTQEVLFLSFFSQKDKNNKANFKVFIWGKKYITQKLQKDDSYKWSKACIENLIGHWSWKSEHIGICPTSKDRENISSFLKIRSLNIGDEFKAIDKFQKNIMQERLKAKHEKEKSKIDQIMKKVTPLPKEFDKWVYKGPFGFSRYIYYKRKGRKIEAYCTGCKKDFSINETKVTKKRIKHNNKGRCPKCNKKVTYKATGKSKNVEDRASFAIIQKYEDGLIVRYFAGTKTYREHYKNPSLSYWENTREIYRFDDEKEKLNVKRYEYGHFRQTNEIRWCNDSGKFRTSKVYLYTRNLKRTIKETKWQYSCIYQFAKNVNVLYIDAFLNQYIKHPTIEYLIKFKLYKLVDESTNYYISSGVNFEGKSIKEVLGIGKQQLLQMQRLNLGATGLELIRESYDKGRVLKDQQVKWILDNLDSPYNFIQMLDYSTPKKIIRYLKEQSNNKYAIKNVISDWCDYIRQCKELKFDINNSFVLYPKNLKEKHEEYTIMNKSNGLKKYKKKVIKAFEKLDKIYSYEDKKFLIRPANSVDEIVTEGHKLRHCVGGNYYVKGVAKEEIAIMLIREVDNPDKPLYTLELNLKKLYVSQCRGYRNCDTTKEINKFIDKWELKKLNLKGKRKVV